MRTGSIKTVRKGAVSVCIALFFSLVVFAQHSECIPYELSKIEGFEKIRDSTIRFRDSLLYDSIRVLLRDEAYQTNDEHNILRFKALSSSQVLITSSMHGGYWSDYFTVSYAPKKLKGLYLTLKDSSFTCNLKLHLGITKQQLDKYLMKIPNRIINKREFTVYKYYWYDYYSLDYYGYEWPCYVASFVIKNNRLIKFGFGLFRAEIDKDFSE